MSPINKQKGAVLITVLVVLVLITLLGVYAIRQGTTRLNMSTNAQINSVLSVVNDRVMTDVISDLRPTDGTGPLVKLKSTYAGLDAEFLYCYKATQSVVYNPLFTSVDAPRIGVIGSTANDLSDSLVGSKKQGRCNIDPSNGAVDWSDARGFSVVQVSIALIDGKDWAKGPLYRAIVTAIALAAYTGDVRVVQRNCLAEGTRLSNDLDLANIQRESLSECLARYGVPYQTKVQEFYVTKSDADTGD